MSVAWLYPKTTPTGIQGRGISEDNFAWESKGHLDILIREALQNPLDARTSDQPVRVTMRALAAEDMNVEYFRTLLPDEFVARLAASTVDPPTLDWSKPGVLVIEDFGTCGLLGSYTDPDCDGDAENWNAFWYREGEGAKSGKGSNGRAGQGKITYYRAGAARAVFGLTVRADDKECLLMGRSSFIRAYPFQGAKYIPYSFWCVEKNEHALPGRDQAAIKAFSSAFSIERTAEPGLSLVIPFPRDFRNEDAIKVVLTEFYFPIASGRLEVKIGDLEIRATTISNLADKYLAGISDRGPFCSKGYRSFAADVVGDLKSKKDPPALKPGWEKGHVLSPDAFPDGLFDQVRKDVEDGARVALRCPITVRSKKLGAQQTFFDVYLQVPEELDRTEEAYIRRDLLIGAERHLSEAGYLQKARGLTLVSDSTMSAFLADAEEPTHLKWNASRPRLAEDYVSPKDVVRAVRQALPRLLSLISGQTAKRDAKALAKYFSKPADQGKKGNQGGGNVGPVPPLPEPLPPPKPKLFQIQTGLDWVKVLPRKADSLQKAKLPINASVEVAYEGLDLDPFRAYDPFDFDLADTAAYPLEIHGAKVEKRQNNRIDFTVENPDCLLKIEGFDSSIRLRARLTYEENADDAPVDDE